jgi:predicted nucleic acid-binding protein
MIVVDTNIIGYLFITSQRQKQAMELLVREPAWISSPLWRSEFRNVLTGYIRRKIFTLSQAQLIMEDTEKMMSTREFEVDSDRVLSLAANSSCSAYDCEFVALAEENACPLLTVDRQIRVQFPGIAISPEEFLNL